MDSCKNAVHVGKFTTDKSLMYRATFILNIVNSITWITLNIGCAIIRHKYVYVPMYLY